MKNNLEQLWKEEARKAYQDQQSQDNEGGCREPIGFVQGYLAAKKSDLEEIESLKAQLKESVENISNLLYCYDLAPDSSVIFYKNKAKDFLEKHKGDL